jgi:hypothetical protein
LPEDPEDGAPRSPELSPEVLEREGPLLRSVEPLRSVRSVRAKRLAEGPDEDPRFDGTMLERPDRPPARLSDDCVG